MVNSADPFFKSIGAHANDTADLADDPPLTTEGEDGELHPVEEIESLCMDCHENGMTRLLLTYIPHFREVIIMSFRCDHCGCANNEVQAAGEIQERGSIYTVKITDREDLNRQLVKSEHCLITIPEYALQIPASRGQLTTVEGIVSDTIRDLDLDQPARLIHHPDVHAKIEVLLNKLRLITEDGKGEDGLGEERKMPVFTIKLDDPSGNSFVETHGGLSDPKWSKRDYTRDNEQNVQLGLRGQEEDATVPGTIKEEGEGEEEEEMHPEEVLSFPTTCSLCGSNLETLMKTVNIPHFKDIILMSTNCHDCGYRDTEIKSGGAIAPMGRKITLRVEDTDDLSRDILKSETAGLTIPEIELELNPGTLGGRFTTLEGILNQVYEELDEKVFARGDSVKSVDTGGEEDGNAMGAFLKKLKAIMTAQTPFTIILDDPLANSYIQNLYAPDDDPNMESEVYERTHEQNEELGLNDINVDDYGHVEVDETLIVVGEGIEKLAV